MFLWLETVLNKRVPVYLFTLVRMVPVAEAEGVKPDHIIERLLETVPKRREELVNKP